MHLRPLSAHLSRVRKFKSWKLFEELAQSGQYALAGTALLDEWAVGNIAINIGSLYARWWTSERRVVWTVEPDTASEVARVGMGFLPEEPPASWSNGAILIESGGEPLVEDAFSVGAYRIDSVTTGEPWWWICVLNMAGDAEVFGLPCAQKSLNAKLAKKGELLDLQMANDGPDLTGLRSYTPKEQMRALKILRWVFAFSYFVQELDQLPAWSDAPSGAGPPMRAGRKNKVVKRRGKSVHLWNYRSLRHRPEPREPEERGTLDTSGLVRTQTIVSPYWRRVAPGRVKLIAPHLSHRWRKPELLGTKVQV